MASMSGSWGSSNQIFDRRARRNSSYNVSEFVLYCDGASRGNPGPSAIGAAGYRFGEKEPVIQVSERIGNTTNNQAEYRALIAGIRAVLAHGGKSVEIRMDSELAVRQVNGEYKVKNEGLKGLHAEVKSLLDQISWSIRHVPREQNKEADRLANLALDS